MDKRRVVVITGATSGIGAAVARRFASEGNSVILVGRNAERGNRLTDEILSAGAETSFFQCDVTNEAQVKGLAEKLSKGYGKVDVLFNNARIMLESREIENISQEEWKSTFESNIDSMFYVTKYLKPMIVSCRGCIINNASIAGMQSYLAGRSYAYSASKAAVIQFTRQMALNYAEEGIRVNCICPGIIDTPILGTRDKEEYAKRIPLGYIGRPEDVADVVSFLASEQASYLTGVVLPIDGGQFIIRHESEAEPIIRHVNAALFNVIDDIVCNARIDLIQNQSILLTGGTGFVGYYIVLALLYANDSLHLNNVIILVMRNYKKAFEKFGPLLSRPDIRLIIQDIQTEFILPPECKIDYIIHSAMTSEIKTMDENPVDVFDTAIFGTKNIIKLAKEKHIRSMLYLSSINVYGNTFGTDSICENYSGNDDWKTNRACYSLGKRSAEFLCLAEHRKSGLPVKILRPGFVYGASSVNDKRVYAQIINDAAAQRDIVLKSGGYLYRPMLSVSDLVKGIFLTLTAGENGTAYNISTSYCSIREFAEIAGKICGVNIIYEQEEDAVFDAAKAIYMGNLNCEKFYRLAGQKMFSSLESEIRRSVNIIKHKKL